MKKLLKTVKQTKVYIITGPELEEYYANAGFRHVIKSPKAVEELNEKLKKKYEANESKLHCGLIMVHIPEKEDASLKTTPDLLVIDGGKGQLNAVTEVLKKLELTIPVIGLAKREEEVFVPGESLPIDLPSASQASFLLQRLRNEAHRFANAHREKRLAKGMIGSALDVVPGIGEKTKRELLTKFSTVDAIAAASDADLLAVLSPKQLASLRTCLDA